MARVTLSSTLIMSTMISAPYFLPAMTASSMVESSARPRTVTMSAPALAMISTSNAPTSIVLVSAIIFFPGNSLRSARTASAPSLLMRGVPASIQSAPPSTASWAMTMLLFSCMRSNAICNVGMSSGLWLLYLRFFDGRFDNQRNNKDEATQLARLSSVISTKNESSPWHGQDPARSEILVDSPVSDP